MEQRTVQDCVDQIVQCARSESQAWAQQYAEAHNIRNGAAIRRVMQNMVRSGRDNLAETLRLPHVTAQHGGDIEDRAALAISLAIALDLPYEIRVKGPTLLLFVNRIEVLHK